MYHIGMDLAGRIERDRKEDPYLSWSYQSWVSDEYRYIYMSVPKVACTMIKSVLHRLAGRELPPFLGDVHDQGTSLATYSTAQIVQMLSSPDWFKFAFVRNPYQRLFSAYKSKICILGTLDSNSVWQQQYQWLRDDIRDVFDYPYREGKRAGTISFHDYVRYLVDSDNPR